jgi:hypothetical protein
MATATTAKKAPAKKRAAAKKAPAKRANAKKANVSSFKETADKALNVYLGLIGKSVDTLQDNVEQARKDNEKRVKDLEKRGVKLRKELTDRFDKIEMPEIDEVIEDAKAQFTKAQDQVEDAVDNLKEKLTPADA